MSWMFVDSTQWDAPWWLEYSKLDTSGRLLTIRPQMSRVLGSWPHLSLPCQGAIADHRTMALINMGHGHPQTLPESQ
ncbi:hypothetical protein CR513_26177, partial [Mucuna pruriens]